MARAGLLAQVPDENQRAIHDSVSGVRGQHLHSDGAVQPRIMGTEYDAHAAAAELSFNSVAIAQHGWRKGQDNCTRTG